MDDQFKFPEYNMSLDTCAPYVDMYIDSNQLGNHLNFINNAMVLARVFSKCADTPKYTVHIDMAPPQTWLCKTKFMTSAHSTPRIHNV